LASPFICFHLPAIWSLFIVVLLYNDSAGGAVFMPGQRLKLDRVPRGQAGPAEPLQRKGPPQRTAPHAHG
jgi:hypothetical protein